MANDDYIVDAHQHFQDIGRYSYPWLSPDQPHKLEGDLTPIRRNFLPADYQNETAGLGIEKTVHVQNEWNPHDPVGETIWLSHLAETTGLPTAIVGYAELSSPDIDAILSAHSAHQRVRGIRQILNWHENPNLRVASRPDLMEQAAWRQGFSSLAMLGMSFDLQLYWPQMTMAFELAQDFKATQIILNHFGMPIDRSTEGLMQWSSALRYLSRADNVSVKLSGFGLGHPRWSLADTVPLLLEVIKIFGPDRIMFGSNLPVDLLFSNTTTILTALDRAIAGLAPDDRNKIRRLNAERIYRI